MNVHGINQLNQNNNRQYQNENQGSGAFLGQSQGFSGLTVQHLQAVEQYKILFLSGRKKVKNPKDQMYYDMIMDMCCPTFKLLSLTTFMLVVYLILFIVQASIGLYKSGQFLQIDGNMLITMGANKPKLIRQGQVWRLITAAVLHANFMHFFGNFVCTITLLSKFQYSFGTVRCIIFYIISAISGNIFSALCSPTTIKAGASTCLYGLIGVMFGYIILNWNGLHRIGPVLRCQFFCTCFMLIVFIIVFTQTKNIDYFGHIGGLLAGFWLSGITKTIQNKNYEKVLKVASICILAIQLTLFFVLFYKLNLNFGI